MESEKLTSNHIPKSIVSACIYYVIEHTSNFKHYTKDDVAKACDTSVVTIMKCLKDIEQNSAPLLELVDKKRMKANGKQRTLGSELIGLDKYLVKLRNKMKYINIV